MTYEEFKEYVVNHIKDYLPQKYADYEVSLEKKIKNNDVVLDGVLIQGNENIVPLIYLNQSYDFYRKGLNLDIIMKQIAETYLNNSLPEDYSEAQIIEMLSSYDNIKDRIQMRVCGVKDNIDRLANCPHTIVEDLATTYHIVISNTVNGVSSIPITNELIEQYGLSTSQLHQDALNNMSKEQVQLEPLIELIKNILYSDLINYCGNASQAKAELANMLSEFSTEENIDIWYLSNQTQLNGAACIMSEEIREMVAERVGGDYYILPSSIHEVLIVKKDEGHSIEELKDTVMSANKSFLFAEDKLTDNVYEYNAMQKELTLAKTGEAVQPLEERERKEVHLRL